MSLEMPVSGATASESITGLVQLIKEDIEKETLSIYEETISPFTPRPNCPNIEFDSNMEYNIILFDVETNTTGKSAQLCQLSAVDKTGENCFSKYILPDNDIDKYATRVNKLTVKSVEGKRTLFKDDVPLQTLTCQEATSQFVNYIRSCIDSCKARTANKYYHLRSSMKCELSH